MSREEEIFAEALALAGAERVAFLDRVCGGAAALRARVEALLAAHAEAERQLSSPLVIRDLVAPEEKAGDRIGRYKLLEKIGEGGCGAVWMAEQEEPVRRRVALKVIKLGMDTREVIARFEAERQALALMDHPNIAKVFDAGATGNGRPFFVMELVRGVPVTKFCDEANASTAQRLELFIQVCHAVQHAHQKGVIHRDLKPSNILVTVNDGVPVPKVIDFGIAKATQGRLTDQTLFTAFEQFIGTPAYMSPEQAVMTSLDVDTRSDIYSLGVLLYELLTGRTPFDAQELAQAGLDEIRRRIREVEPPKPSTRLSTMQGETLATVARHRHTEPPKLLSLIRGDLDWIVMRCLEKDRARRYATANSLADDLTHHLRDEPVAARPPSAAYRFQKLVHRHRVGFGAGALVAASVVAGLTFSLITLVREKAALERARSADRLTAEARAHAEDVLEFMLRDIPARLDEVGQMPVARATVQKVIDYYDRLPAPLHDGSSVAGRGLARAMTAALLGARGETDQARREYQKARQIFELAERQGPLVPAVRLAYAETLLFSAGTEAVEGRHAEAQAFRKRAVPLLESLQADPRYGWDAQWRLAEALQAVALGLGLSPATRRQALPVLERALAVARAAEKTAPADPRYPAVQVSLVTLFYARTYLNLGELARARELLEQALATLAAARARQPQARSVLSVLSDITRWQQRLAWLDWDEAAATSAMTEFAAAVRAIAQQQPDRWISRRDLSSIYVDEWAFRAANGEWERVRQIAGASLAHFKAAEDNHQMRAFHGNLLARAAQHYAATGFDAEADDCLAAAGPERSAMLATIKGDVVAATLHEAATQTGRRKTEIARCRHAAVREQAATTLALLARLPVAERNSAPVAAVRREALLDACGAAFALGDHAAAADLLRDARGWAPTPRDPATPWPRQKRADNAHEELGWAQVLARAGRLAEARAMFAPARADAEALHQQRPDLFVTQRLLAHACWARVDVEPELPAAERRALLERAAAIGREADRAGRLTRFEREFYLADIERQLAALPVVPKP
jgi:tetratricopeptide (TPR) repeat protein